MPRKSKHSKAYRMNSTAPTDKRKPNAMSMGRSLTRAQFEAREVAGEAVKNNRQDNQVALDKHFAKQPKVRNCSQPR